MSNEQFTDDDVLAEAIRKASHTLASAIMPTDKAGALDSGGVFVSSLTEAVMGLTHAMHTIADAISDVADAIRDGAGPGMGDEKGG